MRKPGRGQILENRLVGPREVLGGGDRRVPAKGRGRTAPCRGRSGASWIWATPLTPARARGSSVRATPSLRPPRILKTSLFLQKGGPRKKPSQRTATALFYLIPCGDFQLSPREFYLSLIRRLKSVGPSEEAKPVTWKRTPWRRSLVEIRNWSSCFCASSSSSPLPTLNWTVMDSMRR